MYRELSQRLLNVYQEDNAKDHLKDNAFFRFCGHCEEDDLRCMDTLFEVSYSYYIRIKIISYLSHHVIIFQKFLLLLYCTHTYVYAFKEMVHVHVSQINHSCSCGPRIYI